ncbi:MAG: phosphate transport system substrate-binding protein [Hyphomonadaceae bacterium]|nr:MAG: phosphate transport system substrate-binding protein [Hyphomonadaceae bacterium]KAF0186929.1 MAG: phosphate transport system substrate-binding protein [Hyphomonadaceae bacterium]
MKKSFKLATIGFVVVSMLGLVAAAAGRDKISIVGSSTVFPFSSAVAEQFGSRGQFPTPKVESTGTGGGMSVFCRGVGVSHPDITNASRKMKLSEYQSCARNGVREIVEVKIGYDGIVVSNSKNGPDFNLTRMQLYMALAKQIPQRGRMIPNPFRTWNQIDPSLPNLPIDVMGPPPTSGTRDAFAELVMEVGARSFAQMDNLRSNNEAQFKRLATSIREDGAWKDAGENDNLIVQTLARNPNQLGIFGFSFFEENMDRVQAATINGRQPTFASISDSSYPISRSLYFYIKKQNIGVVPGIKEFATEFMSEGAAGARGYLRGRGMVPLPAAERARQAGVVEALSPMSAPRS